MDKGQFEILCIYRLIAIFPPVFVYTDNAKTLSIHHYFSNGNDITIAFLMLALAFDITIPILIHFVSIFILLDKLQIGIFVFIYDCKTVGNSRLLCTKVKVTSLFWGPNDCFMWDIIVWD